MTKFVTRFALVVGAALIFLCSLLISPGPAVEVRNRPSAQDLQGARQVWGQLKLARGETASEVRADNGMVSGLAALARDASGVARLDAGLSQGELRGRTSISLPLGMWLNASAAASGSHSGFPPVELTVGRVTFPTAAGRLFANLVRLALRMKGAEIPPLDDVVQSFGITGGQLLAKVRLPSKTGFFDEVVAARSAAIRTDLVEVTFCRIANAQRTVPVRTLSQLAQRTFAETPGGAPEEASRASLVALSLAVAGDRAEILYPGGAGLRMMCPFPDGPLLLQGRADLAKHWSLSAALTAVFGAQAAENLGEWKELQDSLPEGSGFSFVDLAADRAGVRTALSAVAPHTASATRKELTGATEEYLLPKALLQAPEGLSDASFVDRFGSLEQKAYHEAIFEIDRRLSQHRMQRPPK